MYAVNRPFLESRLEEISERELQAKLAPVRAEVIPIEALKEGGKRTDLAFPLLALLIVTLLLEGWLGRGFKKCKNVKMAKLEQWVRSLGA